MAGQMHTMCKRLLTSQLLCRPRNSVRFEVFTAVTMKNAVFWVIKPNSYLTGDTIRLRYRVQAVNVT
jgi:hypothetical protein